MLSVVHLKDFPDQDWLEGIGGVFESGELEFFVLGVHFYKKNEHYKNERFVVTVVSFSLLLA